MCVCVCAGCVGACVVRVRACVRACVYIHYIFSVRLFSLHHISKIHCNSNMFYISFHAFLIKSMRNEQKEGLKVMKMVIMAKQHLIIFVQT